MTSMLFNALLFFLFFMFFPAGQLQRLFTQRLTAFRRALAESVGDGRDWPALWKGADQMLLTRWTRVDTCGLLLNLLIPKT